MHIRDAVALLRLAVPDHSRLWADLGAGTGTFTLALATIIGPEGHIVAVDRDPAALQTLRRAVDRAGAHISTVETLVADFITLPTLPALNGLLIANALHYVPTTEQAAVLGRLGDALRSGGRIVVVEYEGRRPNRWVPYPISFATLEALARQAGLAAPSQVSTRRSAFGGSMYVAVVPAPGAPEGGRETDMHRLSNDALRIFVYDVLLETGRPPTVADISRRFDVPQPAARDTMRSLPAGKTLLAHPDTGEIWMAGPFAGAPTPYRVIGPRVAWFANCAWDMLGIPVVAGESVDIEAQCGDCGEPIRLHVDAHSGPEPDADALVHILVPARHWYDDIGYT